MRSLFTSESVTEGHPDKICDQIADHVLDDILSQDKNARVACEVAVCTGLVLVMGEITTTGYVDIPKIVRETVIGTGYDRAKYGFDGDSCGIISSINHQSPDIAMGVDRSLESRGTAGTFDTGAGDQGMMFGFACDQTPALMPMPIYLAHKVTRRLAAARKSGDIPYLRPDGKAQITVEYEDGRPVAVDSVVVSTQHAPEISQEQIRADVLEKVASVIPSELLTPATKYYVNPTGKFVVGGPAGDSGLTGRKIIVDTYGGYARHGGGSFSGKDPTKVDRSATYAARQIAKSVVACGLARECEVQVAYAIGVARPVSVSVNTFGTETASASSIEKLIGERFDMRPAAIIERMGLRAPIYAPAAAYGHFGREDVTFPWEEVVSL